VELTGTNSSIGLIALINAMLIIALMEESTFWWVWSGGMMGGENSPVEMPDQFASPFRRPGDYCGVAAPDPIPNSAVKRPSADGTPS
jgi:hypothetical protein